MEEEPEKCDINSEKNKIYSDQKDDIAKKIVYDIVDKNKAIDVSDFTSFEVEDFHTLKKYKFKFKDIEKYKYKLKKKNFFTSAARTLKFTELVIDVNYGAVMNNEQYGYLNCKFEFLITIDKNKEHIECNPFILFFNSEYDLKSRRQKEEFDRISNKLHFTYTKFKILSNAEAYSKQIESELNEPVSEPIDPVTETVSTPEVTQPEFEFNAPPGFESDINESNEGNPSEGGRKKKHKKTTHKRRRKNTRKQKKRKTYRKK